MSFEKIVQAIKKYETIIIHRHVRPDPDALGSQGALMHVIQETYPSKNVYVVGSADPSLTFLIEMDTINDDVYKGALVIVCDTANAARIDDTRFDQADMLIKIDHHPDVDKYGDIRYVNTTASSTSEIIYDLFLYAKNNGFNMNDEAARLIYGGIVGDTGRFLFPSTTKKTFQYAADLVTYDFDRTALYDGIYNTKERIARLRGYILQNYTLADSGMSTIKLTKSILKDYGVSDTETGQLVGVLGDVEGVKAWAFFIEEDDLIRVRIRSRGPVINTLAVKYNGGGHPMAAGASVDSWEEVERVIHDLDQICISFGK